MDEEDNRLRHYNKYNCIIAIVIGGGVEKLTRRDCTYSFNKFTNASLVIFGKQHLEYAAKLSLRRMSTSHS